MNPIDFWSKYDFRVEEVYQFQAGYKSILVKHYQNGWLIRPATQKQPFPELNVVLADTFEDDPEVLVFRTGQSKSLVIVPALPNKSVVFKNNRSIKISSKESAELFFTIPLSIQFYNEEVKDENLLCEIPLQRLSDTWFGEPDNGEPAFSIGSNYEKQFTDVKPGPWEAICPVTIINNTASFLDLQRLILRVEDYSLFLKMNAITNSVNIEFKGHDQDSNITLSTRPDLHGEKPVQMAKSRPTSNRNLFRRSFFLIRNIYSS